MIVIPNRYKFLHHELYLLTYEDEPIQFDFEAIGQSPAAVLISMASANEPATNNNAYISFNNQNNLKNLTLSINDSILIESPSLIASLGIGAVSTSGALVSVTFFQLV